MTGRYQIVFSPDPREDAFLLDTVDGEVWQLVESGAVWQHMERRDGRKVLEVSGAAEGDLAQTNEEASLRQIGLQEEVQKAQKIANQVSRMMQAIGDSQTAIVRKLG